MIFKLQILRFQFSLMVGIHLLFAPVAGLSEVGDANLDILGQLPFTIKSRVKVDVPIAMAIRRGLALMIFKLQILRLQVN
jgi:hypothetical protein